MRGTPFVACSLMKRHDPRLTCGAGPLMPHRSPYGLFPSTPPLLSVSPHMVLKTKMLLQLGLLRGTLDTNVVHRDHRRCWLWSSLPLPGQAAHEVC